MIILSLVISFFLEGIFTNLISLNSYLLPLFTITSLTILYPYFNNDNMKFIGVAVIVGFFYDIIYTDSLFVGTFSFSLISVAIIIIYNYINMNWLNINILNIIIIILYKVISYMFLCIIGYFHFKSNTMIYGIYHSLVINFIYGLLLYFITDKIGKKLKLKKME